MENSAHSYTEQKPDFEKIFQSGFGCPANNNAMRRQEGYTDGCEKIWNDYVVPQSSEIERLTASIRAGERLRMQDAASAISEANQLRDKIKEKELIIHGIEEGSAEWQSKFRDSEREIERLTKENEELKGWKESEIKVWGPVLEYMHSDKSLKLGQSISDEVLRRIREFKNQASEIERLRESLTRIHAKSTYRQNHDDMIYSMQTIRQIADSALQPQK